MKAVLIVALVFAVQVAFSSHWAVLLAGSNGYWNYRHQSDICHAYQIVHKNGIPDDHIIVMQYDDIASDGENPYPGKVFNHPTDAGVSGKDVYAGCPKSYTGEEVTAANFLALIQGQKDKVPAGHPVLNSTSNDNVFIYFSDHGASGLIAMPTGDPIYATDLIAALKAMSAKKMFKKLVFYIEACESGSMFANILPTNINVYATTASDPDESSWGWYCDSESGGSSVDGKDIGSCLGDEYSVRWMEDSDLGKATESLQDQFTAVKAATTKSHVMQYGTMTWNKDSIFSFQGGKAATPVFEQTPVSNLPKGFSGVNSRDAKLHYLMSKYLRTGKGAEAVKTEIQHRQAADALFQNLARTVFGNQAKEVLATKPQGICEEKCCQPVVNTIYSRCGGFSDYSLKYVRSVVQMCEAAEAKEEVSNYMTKALEDLC